MDPKLDQLFDSIEPSVRDGFEERLARTIRGRHNRPVVREFEHGSIVARPTLSGIISLRNQVIDEGRASVSMKVFCTCRNLLVEAVAVGLAATATPVLRFVAA